MICERCRAGQMLQYEKTIGKERPVVIRGTRCERCGFTSLENDEDVWSAL